METGAAIRVLERVARSQLIGPPAETLSHLAHQLLCFGACSWSRARARRDRFAGRLPSRKSGSGASTVRLGPWAVGSSHFRVGALIHRDAAAAFLPGALAFQAS